MMNTYLFLNRQYLKMLKNIITEQMNIRVAKACLKTPYTKLYIFTKTNNFLFLTIQNRNNTNIHNGKFFENKPTFSQKTYN